MYRFHVKNEVRIAELTDKNLVINDPQDFLDMIANLVMNDCSRMIIYETNLGKEFFDLKIKLAGEILQKCSNYRFKLAITGDFSRYPSKSLRDFIRESNRGNQVFFVKDLQEAMERL